MPQSRVDFTFGPASGETPLVVDFAAVLNGTAMSYLWTFGDGSTSTESAPSHIYYHAGTYSVELTVGFDDGKSSSAAKTDCIVASAGPMFKESDGLYWLDRGSGLIWRGSRDGLTSKQTIVGGIPTAYAMAVGSSYVYWATSTAIWRAATDFSTGQQLVVGDLPPVEDLAVDTSLNKLYWTIIPSSSYLGRQFDGGIYRANLDGSGRETFRSYAAGSQTFATQVALDPYGGFVYWFLSESTILEPLGVSGLAARSGWQGEIEGALRTGLVTTGICPLANGTQLAASIGLSHIAQYLYWTAYDPGMILVGKIDGSSHWQFMTGLPHPQGIVVDTSDNAIYWSDDNGIHRANLDGSSPKLLYAGHADVIALGP